ncbi:MAG: biopolymer transporter ExbD, partial [Planctomycetota bacterium]|nr:biopolymer transporter ExbD [Planctomycetota bacterium]
MKRPSIFNGSRRELELKMTPMIDVVFLLLVFFVWTSSFYAVEYLLPSSLSEKQGSGESTNLNEPSPDIEFEDIVVRISFTDDQPGWSVNGQPAISLTEVRNRLALVAEIKVDSPVILHPDESVPVGNV